MTPLMCPDVSLRQSAMKSYHGITIAVGFVGKKAEMMEGIRHTISTTSRMRRLIAAVTIQLT